MTVSSDLHRSSKSSIDALLLHKTDWRSIYFITSVAMMDSMRISTVLSNSWPYISSLDPEITENFNGLGVSVYTLGEDFLIYPIHSSVYFTLCSLHPTALCSLYLTATMFHSPYWQYVPFTLLLLCSLHLTLYCSLHSTVLFTLRSLHPTSTTYIPPLDCSFRTTSYTFPLPY
uniref:Uncharacterized protein n=1 Tax=Meloidogyne incognita TaxID=6306 RepID=A0A914KSU2_MELIC